MKKFILYYMIVALAVLPGMPVPSAMAEDSDVFSEAEVADFQDDYDEIKNDVGVRKEEVAALKKEIRELERKLAFNRPDRRGDTSCDECAPIIKSYCQKDWAASERVEERNHPCSDPTLKCDQIESGAKDSCFRLYQKKKSQCYDTFAADSADKRRVDRCWKIQLDERLKELKEALAVADEQLKGLNRELKRAEVDLRKAKTNCPDCKMAAFQSQIDAQNKMMLEFYEKAYGVQLKPREPSTFDKVMTGLQVGGSLGLGVLGSVLNYRSQRNWMRSNENIAGMQRDQYLQYLAAAQAAELPFSPPSGMGGYYGSLMGQGGANPMLYNYMMGGGGGNSWLYGLAGGLSGLLNGGGMGASLYLGGSMYPGMGYSPGYPVNPGFSMMAPYMMGNMMAGPTTMWGSPFAANPMATMYLNNPMAGIYGNTMNPFMSPYNPSLMASLQIGNPFTSMMNPYASMYGNFNPMASLYNNPMASMPMIMPAQTMIMPMPGMGMGMPGMGMGMPGMGMPGMGGGLIIGGGLGMGMPGMGMPGMGMPGMGMPMMPMPGMGMGMPGMGMPGMGMPGMGGGLIIGGGLGMGMPGMGMPGMGMPMPGMGMGMPGMGMPGMGMGMGMNPALLGMMNGGGAAMPGFPGIYGGLGGLNGMGGYQNQAMMQAYQQSMQYYQAQLQYQQEQLRRQQYYSQEFQTIQQQMSDLQMKQYQLMISMQNGGPVYTGYTGYNGQCPLGTAVCTPQTYPQPYPYGGSAPAGPGGYTIQ